MVGALLLAATALAGSPVVDTVERTPRGYVVKAHADGVKVEAHVGRYPRAIVAVNGYPLTALRLRGVKWAEKLAEVEALLKEISIFRDSLAVVVHMERKGEDLVQVQTPLGCVKVRGEVDVKKVGASWKGDTLAVSFGKDTMKLFPFKGGFNAYMLCYACNVRKMSRCRK